MEIRNVHTRCALILLVILLSAPGFAEEPNYRKQFSGMHLTSYCVSLLSYALGLDHYSHTSMSNVMKSIDAAPTLGTRKLEIGGGTNPVCEDCTQVDLYTSSLDMAEKKAREDAKLWDYVPTHKEALQQYTRDIRNANLNRTERLEKLSRESLESEDSILEPFAVVNAKEGIIAPASKIPLPSQSVSMIAIKNFHWFTPIELINRTPLGHPWYGRILTEVNKILLEFDRLLIPGGQIFILANDSKPFKTMWNHIQLAKKLGYTVTIIDVENKVSGIGLRKVIGK